MKKNIAILLPYKEKYNLNNAGAASIWIKDYLRYSKLKSQTIIFGSQNNKIKPLTQNYKNISLEKAFLSKNIFYTNELYKEHLKNKFSIIEVHNRPESLIYLINKNISSKLIFIFHNNPIDMRGSSSIKQRMFIAENTDQIYFVSNWVKENFLKVCPINLETIVTYCTQLLKNQKSFQKKKN